MVTELWIETENDLNETQNTSTDVLVTGHSTFQLIRDGVRSKSAVLWPMYWPCWSAELANMAIGPHTARSPYMRLHYEHGVWMQNMQKRGTTLLNFRYWKAHEWPWWFSCGLYHPEFQISIAQKPSKIGPMFVWHFWLGMMSDIRPWSIDTVTRHHVFESAFVHVMVNGDSFIIGILKDRHCCFLPNSRPHLYIQHKAVST
jgi:hypothetical protein